MIPFRRDETITTHVGRQLDQSSSALYRESELWEAACKKAVFDAGGKKDYRKLIWRFSLEASCVNLKGDNKDGHASPFSLLIFKLKGEHFCFSITFICCALLLSFHGQEKGHLKNSNRFQSPICWEKDKKVRVWINGYLLFFTLRLLLRRRIINESRQRYYY